MQVWLVSVMLADSPKCETGVLLGYIGNFEGYDVYCVTRGNALHFVEESEEKNIPKKVSHSVSSGVFLTALYEGMASGIWFRWYAKASSGARG